MLKTFVCSFWIEGFELFAKDENSTFSKIVKEIILWVKNKKDDLIVQNILYFILYKLNRHLLLKIWQKNSWKMKKMQGNVKSDQIWISADDDDLDI